MIWIGTSGFQYPEWKESFYPSALSKAKMLPFYAQHFPTTEINYSFHRIPSEKTLTAWSAATPPEFRFSLKAPREITHKRKLRDCAEILSRFHASLQILEQKLGPVLFQLPPFFRIDIAVLNEFLASIPNGLQCAFEFRHSSWFNDETLATLKARNAALCIAESEDLATPVRFTADFGYLRLRREDYTDEDMTRWAETVAEHRSRLNNIYIYLKHEESAMGPKLAKKLIARLESR